MGPRIPDRMGRLGPSEVRKVKWIVTFLESEKREPLAIEADKYGIQNGFLVFMTVGTVANAEGAVSLDTVAIVNPGAVLMVAPEKKAESLLA